MSARRHITVGALALLMALEGLRLMPYQDIAGVWTDGYGNTENVVPGRRITREKADADLQRHVQKFTQVVIDTLGPDVPQGMLDSFVLLTHNIGESRFRSSTAVAAYKAGDYSGACLYAMRYNKATVKGKKRVVRGLADRRYQEYNLCISGVPSAHWSQIHGRERRYPERVEQQPPPRGDWRTFLAGWFRDLRQAG